jgi:hypothetical protein
MADRCFTIHSEPRGSNTMKTIPPRNVVRDDIQAHLTGTSA